MHTNRISASDTTDGMFTRIEGQWQRNESRRILLDETWVDKLWETTLAPRISETDALGHINNTTIANWLEAGRTGLFEVFTPDHNFSQWRMLVVSLKIDFLHEIFFGSDVQIRVCIKKIGRSSLELDEEVWQGGVLCVSAQTVYVHVDPHTRKSALIPGDERLLLLPHMC